jgi:hypothetical protein
MLSSSNSNRSDLDGHTREAHASQLVRRKGEANSNPLCSVCTQN